MNDVCVVLISILAGYTMATLSGLFGAWLACKLLAGRGGPVPFVAESKGDVFTIEDQDETALFPDEGKDEGKMNEEHILDRTNKFLQSLQSVGGK